MGNDVFKQFFEGTPLLNLDELTGFFNLIWTRVDHKIKALFSKQVISDVLGEFLPLIHGNFRPLRPGW